MYKAESNNAGLAQRRRIAGHGWPALWAASLLPAFALLNVYTHTPDALGPPPPPSALEELLQPSEAGKWLLVVAVHPKCPCTLATVSELQRLLRRVHARLQCRVLVFQPADADESWTSTRSINRLRNTLGVRLEYDPASQTAKRLGLTTSGETLLLSPGGEACFRGGITSSRGHEGANAGQQAVEEWVQGRPESLSEFPVYGCRL